MEVVLSSKCPKIGTCEIPTFENSYRSTCIGDWQGCPLNAWKIPRKWREEKRNIGSGLGVCQKLMTCELPLSEESYKSTCTDDWQECPLNILNIPRELRREIGHS